MKFAFGFLIFSVLVATSLVYLSKQNSKNLTVEIPQIAPLINSSQYIYPKSRNSEPLLNNDSRTDPSLTSPSTQPIETIQKDAAPLDSNFNHDEAPPPEPNPGNDDLSGNPEYDPK